MEKFILTEGGKQIAKNLEFGGALATITNVKIDKNLENAIIKVSVWPKEKENEILRELKGYRFELQSYLFKKLKTWKFPKLDFEIDHGPENAAQVEKIIIEEIETPLSKRKKTNKKKATTKKPKK
jgi:ribosome-binding factor A